MWYLKVSSSLLIAVALICMIQNAISLTIDPEATEDQWSTLASSTDQNDLKKISKLCKVSFNNFKEKLENTKTIANKKLPEPNKTTEDIANLVSDIKNQVKNASADLVTVRKLVQKTALRFRDTFKSLVSFTELDCESVNKELESIKKTTVDSKKPLVNRVIRSFGNRYDLNKLANKVLEISSDPEKLKNNYVEKKKIAKKEFNSLWNSLSNHSKTMNDNALKALDTFFEGMKSVKSVKKKVKTLGEDALDEIKVGDDIIKLKNAVELAKSLKLKFEDEWNLDSGELTYSEEQKKPNTKPTDQDQSDVQENVEDKSNKNISTKDLEPGLPTTEQELIENDKSNVIPSAQVGIEKLPIMDNRQSIPNTENKDKTVIVQPEVSNNDQGSIENDNSKSDSSTKQTSFNLDINNNTVLNTPLKDSIDNKRGKRINKITSREKSLILPWEKLIQLDDPHVSQQSMKCENLLKNVTPDFDNIKKAAKNSIQVTKNYKNLQNIENDTVKQFYDKMVDTNTNLCDYLVNAADDVCAKVTPINKRYETKFKNDPNIKRIKYLLGKQYDPNQYILKVLDDANHKKGIGGMKKTTYYKMLAVAHNLSHETKEMENSALYAMNKIHEGKLAATNLQKKFNKEKASKACYIRNILLEKENEDDKKNKDENKEKVKESINEDTNTEPLKPDVNLDSVDAIQPSTVNDDNEPIINNDEDTTTLSEPNELKNLNNQKENADKTNIEESKNIKGNMGSGTQEPNSGSYLPQNKDNNINKSIEKYGNNKGKRNITRKITHHTKHRNPNDPNDVSEEYDSIEEIDDEEDESNERKNNLEKTQNGIRKENPNITSRPKISEEIESLEQEGHNNLNKSGERNEEIDKGNSSVKPKVKHYRKRIDPKNGKEIVEEYESSSEEHDINSNKSGENKSNESPESELSANADNEHDTDTPEHLDTEKVASHEEDATREENNEGKNTSVKPKVKHYRKRIDPKDGKEIVEEYESSSEEGEHDINSSKSSENTSNETPESELSTNADNEHDTDTPEHLETEKVASNEENDEGKNTSVKPKVKHYRKRIDPKDGKEIVEEYESSSEEHDINSNNSGENKSKESPESELSDNSDNEHDTDTPEHLETEKVASHEEDSTREENDEGKNTSVKPKVKHYRKRIDPKDGKEIVEEYESSSEEHDINSNKSGENKSNESPESELSANADNEHDTDTLEHLETEKVALHEENETSEEGNGNKPNEKVENESDEILDPDLSNNYDEEHDEKEIEQEEDATREENNEGKNTSVKPKVKHYRKRIDPKDGKEIVEEYESSSEEHDINSNKSGENKSNESPDSELSANADNEHDTDTPEHLETEKVALHEQNETSEEGNGNKPNEKVENESDEILDPDLSNNYDEEHDEKEIEQEENENDDYVNNNPEKENEFGIEEQTKNKRGKHRGAENSPKNESDIDDDLEHDSDNSREFKAPPSDNNEAGVDPQNTTRETVELDENENLNSVEGAELNGVDNDNIIPAADSMGEDSSSFESSYEEPAQSYLNDSKNSHKNNNEQYNPDDQPNKISKGHRKRKELKNGQEVLEEYDPDEEQEDDSPVVGKNIHTPSGTPDQESVEHNKTEHEPESSEYEDIPEHEETPENDKSLDHNEANEHEVIDENENDKESNEAIDKSNDIEQQKDGGNQPNKKKRRNRKRRDPKDGQVESEEYDPDDVQKDESPVSNENIDTNTGEPHGESTDPDSETPEYEDISEHDEAPETPDHNEANEHEVIDENENDRESNEAIDKSNDSEQQKDGGNQPNKKKRRNRKRRDPKDGQVESEEYDPDDVQKDESPVSNENIDTNTGEPHGESTDPDSEMPEYEDISEHDEAPETPDHNEANEHEVIDENENDRESNEAIDKSNDIEQQKDGGNQPNKKKRRNRKRREPKDGQVESEEYDPDDVQKDESPVSNENIDTNTGEPHGESTDPDSETPEYEDISEHDEAPETPDHNESNEHKVIDENENDRESNEAIDKSNDIEQQKDGGNQPNKKKRRNRKRRDPKGGQVESEEYDPDEVQKDESPVSSENIDTNTGEPHGESTDPDSETPEYEDISEHDEAPETPDHNESNEHAVIDKNENDRESNEAIDKSNDIEQQKDGGNQPNKKKRRNRKRRDPKDGQVESEEYDPDDVQKDESPVSNENIDTNTGEPHGESTDPDSETPEYEDISEHDEAPETPDHNESNEHAVIDKNENDRESNEAIDKSNDIEQQKDGGNQPNKKKRRNRKRRDPKDGQVESEEYDPDEVQKDESPVSSKNIDTPTGEPHGESTDPDSETPEYEDISEHDEAPETPDHNESNGHEVIDKNENDRESNEAIDKSNDIEQQKDGGNQPNKKKRRNRKRRDPKDGQVESEEYDPDDVQKDESPVSNENIDTNTGEPHGESTDPESETPEYEDISEHDEAKETPDHNESNEHEVIDENENDRESNEAIDKSNDIEQQKDGGNQPNKKKRRNRKRRDPKDGQVESEEYDPDDVQKDESPVSNENIDTNTGEPHGESTDPDSETPEYEDISEHDEAPETPDHNESNEHAVIDKNENDRESNEAIDKSNDSEQQKDGGNQPNKKKRRNRKRRDPKVGQVESEEYDPDDVQKDESPVSSENIDTNTGEPHGKSTDPESETPEYEDISEHDGAPETPDHNESNGHAVIDKNENDRESNEAIDKSNDIEQQKDGGNQPNKKKRRNRKRRDPKDGQVESEEYDPDDVQKDESPVSNENIDTNTGEPHGESTDPDSETPEYEDISEHDEAPETPDHNESNEHAVIDKNENDRESNEAIDKSNDSEQQKDGGNQPNKKKRRNRKRRDPKVGQVESEEYDPDDVQKDESPVSSENIDTNTGEPHGKSTDPESETPEYEDISEHDGAPETPDHNESNGHAVIDKNENDRESNEAIDKSNDIEQQKDGGNQPNKKKRRNRKRRDPKDGQVESEEYDPDDVQKDESPVSSENIDTNTGEPHGKSTDPESETPEYEDISEHDGAPETPDHNESNGHAVIDKNENDRESNEAIDKSNDIEQQKDGGNQPNKKKRRNRKRRDPKDGQVESEEYDPDDVQKDESPVSNENIDTNTGEPHGESTDPDSETPEYEDISEHDEAPETPDHNEANEHEVIDENGPERVFKEAPTRVLNGELIDRPMDDNELESPEYDGVPENGEIPENGETPEYNQANEHEVIDENGPERVFKEAPTRVLNGELIDRPMDDNELESPEYDGVPENGEIPENGETPEYNQLSMETDEHEPGRSSNEAINKLNDIEDQNNAVNYPNKKMRSLRKQKHPKYDHEVPEEYDTVDKQEYEPPVLDQNNNTDPGEPEYKTEYESDTPENEEIPEYNQLNDHAEISELVPDRKSDEEKDIPKEMAEQNNASNQPKKKIKRNRKLKDPLHSHEISEEYETIEDENDEINKLETPNTVPYDQFDKNPISSPNNDNNENNLVNPLIHIPKRFRNRKHPEYDHEISEEYDSFEEYDEQAELKKHTLGPEINDENRDLNNNVIPNIDNDVSEDVLNTGYNKPTVVPQTIFEDNNEVEPESSEYPDNKAIEASPTVNDFDKTMNVAKPRPRKVRRHRKSRQPKTVNENDNEPEVINDDNNVQEELPETVNGETTDTDDEIEKPELSEYPENSDFAPEGSSINDVYEPINVAKPRPRKVRCHRKSRQPKTVIKNDNEPEVINDDNNVQEELPETGNGETTDTYDEIEQPELSENSDVAPEGSSPNYVYEPTNVAKPRPRKVRRHRKSRQPKTVNENDNEPEVINDDNNVQEELPETVNGETTDTDDEIEKPELSEYPENSYFAPEGSSINDVYEPINVAKPRPRKVRCHRKSRQPKTVIENDNEPEVINDDNNVQEELPETGNGETTDTYDEIEQPELSENSDVAPEGSSPNDVYETINVAKPRPRKVRRHRKSRQPKTVIENDNEPEVINDDNNVQEELPETVNGETTDTDNEIEKPELSEYPENSDFAPEGSSINDVYEPINVAKPRPRKVRCHRKSRQPKTVIENDNEPEVINDDNNVQEELPETGNGETTDTYDEIEQPELSENSDVAPEGSSPNDVYETINVAKPRPRKVRRHRKSRQPKTVIENDNEPEVINDDNNVQEELPETGNGETTDTYDEIEQPELSENSDVAPEGSSPNDVYETINVAKPRPRKVRRHRKSRQPKTVIENDNEPEVINDDNNVQEELPETVNGETTDTDNEIEKPELSEYPENSDFAPEGSSPNDVYETINVAKPRPRKVRRHRKSRQPKTVIENDNEPEVINDDNNVQEELPETGNGETTDTYDEIEQPELSENSGVAPEGSSPIDVDETINVAKPRPRKHRRHRKSKQPKIVNQNYNETEDLKRIPTKNNEDVNYEVDAGENEKAAYLNGTDDTMNSNQPKRKKHVRRKKIPTTVDEITPNSLDTENKGIQNDDNSVGNPGIQPNDTGRNPKKKRRLRRIRTYMVNKATNERIPINDQTYSTTDGLPDTPKNKLETTEIGDSDDLDSNEDNDDYSSFLFKEYNSDQCKRDAYDRFKKVTSQDAKQIAYRSVLDTSEMRSNMLATIKNAIGNVKISKTLNDVDQSLRTVSYSLKTGLKQTVSDLVTKVIPLAKDFLKTAENLKELYENGPQSTHKMLSNILENESTVPDSAKDVLKLISPQFDVDELINNIFEKPFNTKSLKEKKAKAQRKLISLSKHMDTAISNIDCFVLSAMSAIGIGADTLKLLKSGRVIMSDKHPRAKTLRDAMGIIKSGKKIRNNDVGFTPTLTPPDGFNESDEDDDDEDPDQVAQKNEEFLKTVPDLDDNIPIPKKVPNKRQSLGVIVVHPDKQIEYREVTDTSQLQKFVGDQKKKYKLQSKNKHPKFLKLNSKKLIDSMVADVKKKAERNGMSKKEMVEEIIKNLKSS